MITSDDVIEIGALYKPHGIKGELSASFDYGIDPSELRCVVLEVDGIYVPFFIESSRTRGKEQFLIKFEGINDEKEATPLAKHTIYGIAEEIEIEDEDPEDGIYLYDFIGYKLFDGDKPVGTIEMVDDSTENILFYVKDKSGANVMVPFAEELLESFDTNSKTLIMNLPEGIINLNN